MIMTWFCDWIALHLMAFLCSKFYIALPKTRVIGNSFGGAVCLGTAAITSVETNTCSARGAPLTQMPQWSTHTTCAIRSEGPDMTDHLEREGAMQTWLFSQLWYAKHTKHTPAKGPISVAQCLAVHIVRTQRISVSLLCTGCGPM